MENFKKLTLELYAHTVIVYFKPGSECHHMYGAFIEGKLTGRIWAKGISEVIGINIATPQGDITIFCIDINKLEKKIAE